LVDSLRDTADIAKNPISREGFAQPMEPAPAAPETDSLPNSLCRDCGTLSHAEGAHAASAPGTCGRCGSARIVTHPELAALAIAHVDCDAFYASVEKRDHPDLIDEPLIVGGSQRGVVLTACYIARRYGVRSAMPMARALQLCPGAAVIKPDMEKYRRESLRIRDLMEALSERVESVSIDEAYLDLSECGNNEPPARSLARLALQVEKRVGVTISIGLAPNKMLAKIASDFGKPRGFYIIGESDKLAVLAPMKVSALSGVGPVMARKLEEMGYATIADLRRAKLDELTHRFGRWGRSLLARAHGEDARRVGFGRGRNVSVGAERTFAKDLARIEDILAVVEQISQRVAERLVRSDLAATSLTLKLRRHDRFTTTHACRLHDPTQRAETILAAVVPVLRPKLDGTRYRLVGVTAHDLVPGQQADPPDLFDWT
jgi:DNA polymerase IV